MGLLNACNRLIEVLGEDTAIKTLPAQEWADFVSAVKAERPVPVDEPPPEEPPTPDEEEEDTPESALPKTQARKRRGYWP